MLSEESKERRKLGEQPPDGAVEISSRSCGQFADVRGEKAEFGSGAGLPAVPREFYSPGRLPGAAPGTARICVRQGRENGEFGLGRGGGRGQPEHLGGQTDGGTDTQPGSIPLLPRAE